MIRIFKSGDAVPGWLLSFQAANDNFVPPGSVTFLHLTLVYLRNDRYIVKPVIGRSQVNAIYIDEMENVIIKGGRGGVVIETTPIVSFKKIAILFAVISVAAIWMWK